MGIASGPAANRPPHIAFEDLSVIWQPLGGNMKFSLRTLLYIVIAAGAIFAGLSFFDNEPQTDVTALEAMREGDMKKLIFSAPKPMVETAFVGEDGQPMTLGAFRGQYTVLNFWATWCAPCRKEMPTLEALDKAFEGKGLDVVTIATGRN